MSGKKERLLRQQLRGHKFPVVTKSGVEVNHVSRIRGLMKSQLLKIDDAIQRHCRKTGMVEKPKAK